MFALIMEKCKCLLKAFLMLATFSTCAIPRTLICLRRSLSVAIILFKYLVYLANKLKNKKKFVEKLMFKKFFNLLKYDC